MTAIEEIKERITALYNQRQRVHITINLSHPRINLNQTPVIITGVYPHVFRVEELYSEIKKSHTLQYNDLLTSNVRIDEL